MLRTKGLFERCCGITEDILTDKINILDYSNKQESIIRQNDTYEHMRFYENYSNFNEEVNIVDERL